MKDGIYSVSFVGPTQASGAGVCYVEGGRMRGGDAGFAYFGNVQMDGTKATAALEVAQHNPGHPSVFGAVTGFKLSLTGNVDGDGRFNLAGSIPGQPTKTLNVRGRWVRGLP